MDDLKNKKLILEILHDIEALLPKSDQSLLLLLIENIIKRNDLSSRIKEEFIRNVHLFRSDFNV